jgi:hypothetical protein
MAATKGKGAKKPAKAPALKNGVPAPEPGDVLTLAEAAAYLRVAEAAVVDSVNSEGLPGRQIGGEWRFLQCSLQDWLRKPPKKYSKEAFLALSGVWKDDPYIDEMLKEIYKQRGRPMTEEEG